jgi:hypothetical protein
MTRYSGFFAVCGRLSVYLPCTRYLTRSCQRGIHATWLVSSEADLERAKQKLATLSEDPGNEVKLKLYSLFKQVRWKLGYLALFNMLNK